MCLQQPPKPSTARSHSSTCFWQRSASLRSAAQRSGLLWSSCKSRQAEGHFARPCNPCSSRPGTASLLCRLRLRHMNQDQLDRVRSLVGASHAATTMQDVPRPPAQAFGLNPLSESEGEEEAGRRRGIENGDASSMALAVSQLTKLVRTLTKDWQKASGLVGVLDKAESGFESEKRPFGFSRPIIPSPNVGCQPEAISSSILQSMGEDLLSRRSDGSFGGQARLGSCKDHRSPARWLPGRSSDQGFASAQCPGSSGHRLCRPLRSAVFRRGSTSTLWRPLTLAFWNRGGSS